MSRARLGRQKRIKHCNSKPAAAGFAVYGCCSVACAASLQHGFGFRFGHAPAGDPVVIVRGDGDVSVPVVDAEQDMVARQEARVFEHGIGDLHPRKGRTSVVFALTGRFVDAKRHRNAGMDIWRARCKCNQCISEC